MMRRSPVLWVASVLGVFSCGDHLRNHGFLLNAGKGCQLAPSLK